MKKTILSILLCIICASLNAVHADNWIKCYEPKGFTMYYNSEKRHGTVELKDFIQGFSDRQEFAEVMGVNIPVTTLIWEVELSSDLSSFRIVSIKGYDDRGNYLGDFPMTNYNENYAKWHAIFPAKNVYTIHAAFAYTVKHEVFDK